MCPHCKILFNIGKVWRAASRVKRQILKIVTKEIAMWLMEISAGLIKLTRLVLQYRNKTLRRETSNERGKIISYQTLVHAFLHPQIYCCTVLFTVFYFLDKRIPQIEIPVTLADNTFKISVPDFHS
jgi:hypothetical protein